MRTHSRSVPLLRKGQMRKHRGNQPKLYQAVKEQFIAQETVFKVNKGHGRIEKRKVSTMQSPLEVPGWLNVEPLSKLNLNAKRDTRANLKLGTIFLT